MPQRSRYIEPYQEPGIRLMPIPKISPVPIPKPPVAPVQPINLPTPAAPPALAPTPTLAPKIVTPVTSTPWVPSGFMVTVNDILGLGLVLDPYATSALNNFFASKPGGQADVNELLYALGQAPGNYANQVNTIRNWAVGRLTEYQKDLNVNRNTAIMSPTEIANPRNVTDIYAQNLYTPEQMTNFLAGGEGDVEFEKWYEVQRKKKEARYARNRGIPETESITELTSFD